MKNLFFLAMLSLMAFIACRNSDDVVQKIDQILEIYIDSLGQDMLNPKLSGAYISVAMNDVYGEKDDAPVSFVIKTTTDSVHYIEYVAGAKRILVDSAVDKKIYESKITLHLVKKINDSMSSTTQDDLKIHYVSTASKFQISQVWYNDSLKFTKEEGEPNVLKISK